MAKPVRRDKRFYQRRATTGAAPANRDGAVCRDVAGSSFTIVLSHKFRQAKSLAFFLFKNQFAAYVVGNWDLIDKLRSYAAFPRVVHSVDSVGKRFLSMIFGHTYPRAVRRPARLKARSQ